MRRLLLSLLAFSSGALVACSTGPGTPSNGVIGTGGALPASGGGDPGDPTGGSSSGGATAGGSGVGGGLAESGGQGAGAGGLQEAAGGQGAGGVPGAGGATATGVSLTEAGLLVDGQPFLIRGVAWNPVKKGGSHPADLDFAGAVVADAPLMADAGINTVRTYVALTDRSVLDTLLAHGIHVISGVYQYGGSDVSEAAAAVGAVQDHPAILFWSLGNEWNYNGLYTGLTATESQARLNTVAELVRAADPSHPIASIYGEVPPKAVVDGMPLIDIWGINSYRGLSFGALFDEVLAQTSKPIFVSEYGADAYDATKNAVNEEAQATATRALTIELGARPASEVLGGTIFEWCDEWWKDDSGDPSVQDVGGVAPGGGPYPDQTFNEEWWGLVTIDRAPRPALTELKGIWRP